MSCSGSPTKYLSLDTRCCSAYPHPLYHMWELCGARDGILGLVTHSVDAAVRPGVWRRIDKILTDSDSRKFLSCDSDSNSTLLPLPLFCSTVVDKSNPPTPHHIPHHTLPHHTTPSHTTPSYTTHHIQPHHTQPHNTTSYPATPHHTLQQGTSRQTSYPTTPCSTCVVRCVSHVSLGTSSMTSSCNLSH